VTLGLETWPAAMQQAGWLILAVDRIALTVFAIEVALRLLAHGRTFFRDPWSVFDFLVVGIALVPAGESFSVLRALRVLRVLRLISAVPKMRMVVQALLTAIPGISSIVALLGLIFYVAAVMATKLFSPDFPEWFGTIGRSVYSLFQIMTLESWSMGIVRPVMAVYPYAWAFFVPFILIATFMILNLFIAVVVNAMQSQHEAERVAGEQIAHDERGQILAELRELRQALRDLHELRARAEPGSNQHPAGR
jgi:voltage-gated sodium channel